jgi:hypothetical protein
MWQFKIQQLRIIARHLSPLTVVRRADTVQINFNSDHTLVAQKQADRETETSNNNSRLSANDQRVRLRRRRCIIGDRRNYPACSRHKGKRVVLIV